MLNRIVLMGRLTRDPELRKTQSDTPVCSFSLAVDRDYKKDGEKKETDFIDIVAWRSTAEFVRNYFAKGRMAVVEGRLQIREWTDKEGGKRRSAEVVADNVYFGDSKPKNSLSIFLRMAVFLQFSSSTLRLATSVSADRGRSSPADDAWRYYDHS